jgi:hypothetical protein
VLYAYLFDGFEAKGVGLELIGEAGGLRIELVRHIPHTGGELEKIRIKHRCAAYNFLAKSSWFIFSDFNLNCVKNHASLILSLIGKV